MTDFAFIKLSAFKANTDELGSADWPVIILWAIVGIIYVSMIFLAGRECNCFLKRTAGLPAKKNYSCFVLLGIAALALSTIFLNKEKDYETYMTRVLNIVTMVAFALTIALGGEAIRENKEQKNEKEN